MRDVESQIADPPKTNLSSLDNQCFLGEVHYMSY